MKFGKFKERRWTKKGDNTTDKEKSIERKIEIDDKTSVVEGIVYEFKSKWHYEPEKGFVDSQQHMIGYHYFIKIRDGEDIDGFQGDIKDGVYNYFRYDETPIISIKYDLTYKQGLALFNKRNRMDIEEDLATVIERAKSKGIKIGA